MPCFPGERKSCLFYSGSFFFFTDIQFIPVFVPILV